MPFHDRLHPCARTLDRDDGDQSGGGGADVSDGATGPTGRVRYGETTGRS